VPAAVFPHVLPRKDLGSISCPRYLALLVSATRINLTAIGYPRVETKLDSETHLQEPHVEPMQCPGSHPKYLPAISIRIHFRIQDPCAGVTPCGPSDGGKMFAPVAEYVAVSLPKSCASHGSGCTNH